MTNFRTLNCEEAKAEVRRLRYENQNLRARTHKTILAQKHRIDELEAQIQQTAWTWLPWRGYVS